MRNNSGNVLVLSMNVLSLNSDCIISMMHFNNLVT